MDNSVRMVVANIPCMLCVAVSGFLVTNEMDGWGWFLFGALCMFVTVRTRRTDDNEGA